MRVYRLRRLTTALVPALLWVGLSPVRAHHVSALSHGGSVLVAITTYRGNSQSSDILAVQGGAVRVLLHQPQLAFYSLVPSPDGRRVAALGCCRSATAGIWTFHRDGSHLHRIVRLRPSTCGNPLGVGSIAWSPGGRRLAYTVFIPSDAIRSCPPDVRDGTGVWVTPYNHPRPRQVEFENYVFSSPPLTWFPDGRTLAVNGGNGPGNGPDVRALDVATGASRSLVRGGYAGIDAPVTGALAYFTGGSGRRHVARIWVAGAQGRRRHILVSTTLRLADSPLVWSPDGRSMAYATDTGSGYRRGARTLVVAGAVVSHPRTLVLARGGELDSPAWSPDGLSIAYSGVTSCACPRTSSPGMGPAVFIVDVGTEVQHILVAPRQLLAGQRSTCQVTSIAWAAR